jgi:hypothetical protein
MARTKVAKNLLDSQGVFSEVKNSAKRSYVKDSNANVENKSNDFKSRKLDVSGLNFYTTETVESKLKRILAKDL